MNGLKMAMLCASVMLLSTTGFTEEPKAQDALVFDFKGLNSMEGWAKTASLEAIPMEEQLELKGNGWDSKIYRSINLEPGYYLLTGTGKGESLHIKLATNASVPNAFFDMNIAKDDWRTDWRPFAIDKPTKAVILVSVGAATKTEAMIKQIKIEKASPEPKAPGIPSVEELERQKPTPEIVRGCDFFGSKSAPDGHAILRSWNANVARRTILLKPSSYVDGLAVYAPGWEESQMPVVEEFLDNARKVGLKVVLDLRGNVFQKDPVHHGSWSNPKLGGTVASVWQGVAKRLLPYRDVIYGYDLYNEPLDWDQMPHAPKQWRAAAIEAIKAIREVDKDTWIIYETGPGGMHWGFGELTPLPDSRVIYSIHFYSPHEFTHQGVMDIKNTDLAEVKAKLNVRYPGVVNGFLWNKESIEKSLEPVRQFQLKYHVPILVGEFSVVRWAPKEDAAQYLKDLIDIFEDNNWSWIYHGFREWHGWCVDYDENFSNEAPKKRLDGETERSKALKAGLAKNLLDSAQAPDNRSKEAGNNADGATASPCKK